MFDKAQTEIKKIPYTTMKKRIFKTTAADLSIGQKVIYFYLMGDNGPKSEPFATTIQSNCWEACGSTLVKVEGKSGGVDIQHIQLLKESEAANV